jgi:hypothetical protein
MPVFFCSCVAIIFLFAALHYHFFLWFLFFAKQ